MEFLADDPAHAVVALMLSNHGMNLSSYSDSFLRQTLDRRMAERHCASEIEYLNYLKQNRLEAKAFVQALTVPYSEFFRDPFTFGALEEFIIPQLLERASAQHISSLRVWCAACAAGQEAWSLAMLIEEANRNRRTSVPYQIFASDISDESLSKARRAIYSQNLLGNIRLSHLSRYFQPDGDSYKISTSLRRHVQFTIHDLLEELVPGSPSTIPSGFHLVVCRNVLFYFRPEIQRQVIEKLRRFIAPGGLLVLGEAERLMAEAAGFRNIAAPLCVLEPK